MKPKLERSNPGLSEYEAGKNIEIPEEASVP
jgi:hypothetical protein